MITRGVKAVVSVSSAGPRFEEKRHYQDHQGQGEEEEEEEEDTAGLLSQKFSFLTARRTGGTGNR